MAIFFDNIQVAGNVDQEQLNGLAKLNAANKFTSTNTFENTTQFSKAITAKDTLTVNGTTNLNGATTLNGNTNATKINKLSAIDSSKTSIADTDTLIISDANKSYNVNYSQLGINDIKDSIEGLQISLASLRESYKDIIDHIYKEEIGEPVKFADLKGRMFIPMKQIISPVDFKSNSLKKIQLTFSFIKNAAPTDGTKLFTGICGTGTPTYWGKIALEKGLPSNCKFEYNNSTSNNYAHFTPLCYFNKNINYTIKYSNFSYTNEDTNYYDGVADIEIISEDETLGQLSEYRTRYMKVDNSDDYNIIGFNNSTTIEVRWYKLEIELNDTTYTFIPYVRGNQNIRLYDKTHNKILEFTGSGAAIYWEK